MVINDFIREKYIGKTVLLYPGDTFLKKAIIIDLDECGWSFKFIEGTNSSSGYSPGDIAFINHAKNITFKFI